MQVKTMPPINERRLLEDLRELRTFGGSSSHPLGVVRPSFSEADMASRHWLRKKFEDAGLVATIDGVGNVIGRSVNPGPALLLGSHSDTQPRGGWLDGEIGSAIGRDQQVDVRVSTLHCMQIRQRAFRPAHVGVGQEHREARAQECW